MISIDVESSSADSDDSWMPSKGPPGAGPASGRRYRWVWMSSAPSQSASSRDTVEPLPSWAQAAYEDGSMVEYYLCHHDQWFLAVVSLAALQGTVPSQWSTTSGLAEQNRSAMTWTSASCDDHWNQTSMLRCALCPRVAGMQHRSPRRHNRTLVVLTCFLSVAQATHPCSCPRRPLGVNFLKAALSAYIVAQQTGGCRVYLQTLRLPTRRAVPTWPSNRCRLRE